MIKLLAQFMTSEHQYISRKDEGDRMIVFERGNLVFVFNFHWNNSYFDYRIGCLKPGKYKVSLPQCFLSGVYSLQQCLNPTLNFTFFQLCVFLICCEHKCLKNNGVLMLSLTTCLIRSCIHIAQLIFGSICFNL